MLNKSAAMVTRLLVMTSGAIPATRGTGGLCWCRQRPPAKQARQPAPLVQLRWRLGTGRRTVEGAHSLGGAGEGGASLNACQPHVAQSNGTQLEQQGAHFSKRAVCQFPQVVQRAFGFGRILFPDGRQDVGDQAGGEDGLGD